MNYNYTALVQTILLIFGIIVNAGVFCYVCKTNVKDHTLTILLRFQTVSDIGVLILYFLCFCLQNISFSYEEVVHQRLLPYLLAGNSIFLGVSCLLLVCIFLQKQKNSSEQKSNLTFYLGISFGVTVLFNIPKFFELQTNRIWDFLSQSVYYEVEVSEFRRSKTFLLLFMVPHLLFFSILPMIFIIIFNLKIIKKENTSISLKKFAKSMLVPMFIIFCHLPRTFLTAYEIVLHLVLNEERKHISSVWIIDLSHTLLLIGSSFNSFLLVFQEKSNTLCVFKDTRFFYWRKNSREAIEMINDINTQELIKQFSLNCVGLFLSCITDELTKKVNYKVLEHNEIIGEI